MRHFIRKFFVLVLVFALGFAFLLCCFEHRSAAQNQELLWPPAGLIVERTPISQYHLYPQFAGQYLAYNFLSQPRSTNIPTMFQSDFQIMSTAPTVFPAQSLSTAKIPTSLSIGYATQQAGIPQYATDILSKPRSQLYTLTYSISEILAPQPLVDMIVSHVVDSSVYIPRHPTMFGWMEGGWYISGRDPMLHSLDPFIMNDILSELGIERF
ncbi:MAG: hypothetical protein ACMUIU_18955 [bacterium]